MKTFLLIYEME